VPASFATQTAGPTASAQQTAHLVPASFSTQSTHQMPAGVVAISLPN